MRAVVQRVASAYVKTEGETIGRIQAGLLVLVAVTHEDGPEDAHWLAQKIARLRIFNDAEGKMNLALADISGEVLVVSQFTLYADCKKGHRPSFSRSAPPETAVPLYELFLKCLSENLGFYPQTGKFGAKMEVGLVNDGPVTLILDSKNRDL
ncbi:MAG: D-aminoacyl-tRNA deacylase [Bacteroidia bacterium]|nr:D-aminoacyl-tRNA deacylase [Bacteroidia bacterium]MDW8332660.1 D-aminoacyl-tRNA deacylase [Bacteroidia bacterium]